jgi:DNA (cytosine-5)-methyltransferase 1
MKNLSDTVADGCGILLEQQTSLVTDSPLSNLPKILDLFSGCGGLSQGFMAAGFGHFASIDIDQCAVSVCEANHPSFSSMHLCADIAAIGTNINSSHLSSLFLGSPPPNDLVVIGGPPCQAYSSVGRGKLNSLGEDRHHLVDHRGELFRSFLSVALELNAGCIVMENVPGSISYGGKNIPDIICGDLQRAGYISEWTILNAADYGVPQTRERVFVMAVRSDLGFNPKWPVPTHQSPESRDSYFGNARKLYESRTRNSLFYVPPPVADQASKFWVTVSEALSDLPTLRPTAADRYRSSPLNLRIPYTSAPNSEFQSLMRNSGNRTGTTAHVYRNTPRDFRTFELMRPGDNYPDAVRLAEKLLEDKCRSMRISKSGNPREYEAARRKIVPPYDATKFVDKWCRLDPDKPSRTIVAHLSVDTYSHIHPWEPRGISVREAARLQSFPDDFQFWGSTQDAFKQIGNAVPPLLAAKIAQTLAQQFKQNSPLKL